MSQRPDASMDLLRQLEETAVDPEYAEHASRRTARRSWRRGSGVVLVTAVLGLGLGAVGSSLWRTQPQAAAERAQLVTHVRAAEDTVDRLRTETRQLREDVDRLQSEGLGPGASASTTKERVDSAELAAGATPVTGPGLVLVLDDAPEASGDGEQGRVLDLDVRRAVNGLWEAGAEAVAINGHRITTRTSIRSAGSAITVGYRSLERPYRIEAIGDPRQLPGRFAATAGSSWLTSLASNDGIRVDASPADRVALPGEADLTVRHARKR